jgi:hypothetical protein
MGPSDRFCGGDVIARKDFTQETAQKGKFASSRTEKLAESPFLRSL